MHSTQFHREIGNLIAKASIVIIDIVGVDPVAGFLEHIAYAAPFHGHEVDGVLEGEDVEDVVVEDLPHLQDLETFHPKLPPKKI